MQRALASLRDWLVERASGVLAASRGLLAAARRLRGIVDGRDLSELVGDEALAEMLLGGFDPRASDPYAPGSLARLYRDLYGVQVLSPRLLAARLRDGLPLRLASRGVAVSASETRFTRLVEALAGEAQGLLGALGAGEPEPLSYDTGDPLWGLEAARRLVEEAVALLPPYSREAMVLFAASAPAPLGVAERLGASAEELRGLGLGVAARLPGSEAPGSGALRVLVDPGPVLARYRCLALAAARLLQLDELRGYIEAPDPVAELAQEALREAPREELAGLAKRAAGRHGQRLPLPRGCGIPEAPVLPLGVWSYSLEAALEDVELRLGDEAIGTYMDLVETLLPLLYRGLAGLEPLEAGKRLRAWFTAPQQP